MSLRPALLLAALAIASAASAEDARFEAAGAFQVKRPADWQRADDATQGRVTFAPPDGTGSCILTTLPGEVSTLSAAEWVKGAFAKMADGAASSKAADPAVRGPWAVQTGTITDASGGKARVAIYAARMGKRIEGFLYLSDDAKAFKKHRADVEGIVDSATWPGRNEPGPIKGLVYRHYKSSLLPAGVNGQTVWRTDMEHLTLFEDGLASDLWPTNGVDTLDPNEIHENAAHDGFGTWSSDGKAVTIRWHTGIAATFEIEDGKLLAGRLPYLPVAPVDGFRFAGRYEWMGTSALSWIEFQEDGTFDGDRVLDMIPNPNGPEHPGRGTGTYTIRDFALELKWDKGGFEAAISFDAFGDDLKKPSSVGLAGTTFGKK